MNTIVQRENSPHQIQRLAAQRRLYASAKVILVIQMILAGPVAVATALIAAANPMLSVYVGLWGWLVTISDVAFVSKLQRHYCEEGAKVQELFDCEALDLPWNDLKTGYAPDAELIKRQSGKYKSASMPTLANWYAVSVAELPISAGRIACQRSNCWWDETQRIAYSRVLQICLAGSGILVLLVSALAGLTVESALKGLVLPLGPAIVLSLRQIYEHNDAASRVARLKNYANTAWASAIQGSDSATLRTMSRSLQDELFDHRKRSPPIFDFIFKRLRPGNEAQMNYGVEELVREFQEHRALENPNASPTSAGE